MRPSAALRFAFGRVEGSDHRRRRLVSIVQGVVSGLGSRMVAIGVNLLSVPLTVGYLGPERYGVWALIGSLLAWVRLADLGIGNGLTNSLAAAFGADRPDDARAHVSTALAVLTAIAAVLAVMLAVAWPWLDWNGLLGVHSDLARAEVGPAILAAFAAFLFGFPLSVIGPAYNASQNGKLFNYWAMAGNLAGLLALVAVTQTQGGLVWLVVATSGIGLLVQAMSGIWLFVRAVPAMAPRLRSIRRASAGALLGVGVQFFLIQILALMVFEKDNLMVAHYLGAERVAPYSLTYSLFGLTSLIQTILFRYVWVAYSEAIARRDIDWVRRTFFMNFAFSLGSTAVAVVPLVFIARPFIKLWAGEAVVPPFDLVVWMAAWSMINAFCSPIACLQAAASHMKVQIAYSAVSAVVNVALSVYLVQRWGITGVIAATVISYALFICIPALIDEVLLRTALGRMASQ